MAKNSFRYKLLLLVFLPILVFPVLNGKTKWVKDSENVENREMAAMPHWDSKQMDAYIAGFEKFFNDNFSIRFILLKFFNWFNVKLLHQSPIPDRLVVGKNGWLFFGGYEQLTYRGIDPLSEKELQKIKEELEYRQKYLSKRGCRFYLMIAPVKSSIYYDLIPDNPYHRGHQTWGEQLNAYLKQTSNVKAINVYDRLRAEREKDPLYFRLDDHWNLLGGFYAANEVLKQIHQDFASVETNSQDEYLIQKKFTDHGNLLEMISNIKGFKDSTVVFKAKHGFKAKDVPLKNYPVIESFTDPDEYEKDKEIVGSNHPRLLTISDSFGFSIYPFLSEQFSRSVKIFDNWEYKLNEEIIESEKPDVELLIIWEANIRSLLTHQSKP